MRNTSQHIFYFSEFHGVDGVVGLAYPFPYTYTPSLSAEFRPESRIKKSLIHGTIQDRTILLLVYNVSYKRKYSIWFSPLEPGKVSSIPFVLYIRCPLQAKILRRFSDSQNSRILETRQSVIYISFLYLMVRCPLHPRLTVPPIRSVCMALLSLAGRVAMVTDHLWRARMTSRGEDGLIDQRHHPCYRDQCCHVTR